MSFTTHSVPSYLSLGVSATDWHLPMASCSVRDCPIPFHYQWPRFQSWSVRYQLPMAPCSVRYCPLPPTHGLVGLGVSVREAVAVPCLVAGAACRVVGVHLGLGQGAGRLDHRGLDRSLLGNLAQVKQGRYRPLPQWREGCTARIIAMSS